MKIEYVLAILFLATVILSTSPTTKYLSTGDAWYHYRIAEYTLQLGARPSFDPLANEGESIVYPPLFHYFLATLSKLSGQDVFFISQIYPRIMALLVILTVFLISREFFDERISLLAALFQAMIPTFMLQTSYGWGDHDALSLFLLYLCSLLFIKTIKNAGRRGSAYAFIGGVSLGAFALTWIGFPIFLVLAWAFILAASLLDSYMKALNKDLLYRIALSLFAGLAIASAWYSLNDILPLFLATFLVLAFAALSYFLRGFKFIPFVLLAVLLASSLAFYRFGGPLIENGLVYTGLEEKGILLGNVAELATPTIAMLDNSYGIPVIVPIFGVLLLAYRRFKKVKIEELFFIVWFACFLFIATTASRFIIYFGIFVSILTAFLVAELSGWLGRHFKRDVFLPLAGVVLVVALVNSASLFSILYSAQPWITDDRYDAYLWLKNNSNENDVVMSWWDYSPWINAIADRKTVVNNQPPGRFEDHAIFFGTDDWGKAQAILSKYNVSYVVVDTAMLPQVYTLGEVVNSSIPYYIGDTQKSGSVVYASLGAGSTTSLDTSSGVAWNDYGNGNKAYYKQIGYFDSSKNKLVYLKINTGNFNSTDDFLVAYSNFFIRIPKETGNRVFFQLMYLDSGIPYLRLVYENQHLRIYKVTTGEG